LVPLTGIELVTFALRIGKPIQQIEKSAKLTH
jgi:hypothetical protein